LCNEICDFSVLNFLNIIVVFRWLLSKGRREKAAVVLRRGAASNGKEDLPDKVVDKVAIASHDVSPFLVCSSVRFQI